VKARSSTPKWHWKLPCSRVGGGTGILGVAVKCVDIKWNTSGEGESLDNS
jgi:hypothetical protein